MVLASEGSTLSELIMCESRKVSNGIAGILFISGLLYQ